MFPNLPRSQVQLISFLLFSTGALIIILGGWHNELMRSIGISLMAGSIWFVMMSESVFLTKVQNEMHSILESLSIKREKEIDDLLFFLRQSQLSADPMSSWEATKNFVEKINFPAMAMSKDFSIAKGNKHLAKVLGYKPGELDGIAGHRINDAVLMSTIAEMYSRPPISEKEAVHSRYVYIHRSGKEIKGLMCASKICNEGFFIVFHPDNESIIQETKLNEILNKSRPDKK